ncbi:MAG: sugar ABC transporter permease, partial [Gammaproteobacteria bacterium]|nr:sugar ABC transporter permease [Gammaproteobacteria bacterium]
MRPIQPIIASNGLAIALTIVILLPIVAIAAFVATTPLEAAMADFGMSLHQKYGWLATELDTRERFAKIGFALRSIVIAVGVSFLYFWISNWLN